ncbi:MAG: amidohydrolase [Pirellulaceae bacterium]|nr:amidohydrolase [Pirellulaceae bacterium]
MNLRSLLILMAGALLIPGSAHCDDPKAWTERHLDDLVSLYRHLHANPELSFQEKETSARMALELGETGADVTSGVGGYGVVAVLRNGNGPTVMVRADMDALPITEETGLAFASTVRCPSETGGEVGVMHACGHDVHMTNLVGVARYLVAHKDRWRGTLVMIAQPAEERGGGARAMLKDGLFEKFPRPDFAIALHVDATLPTGTVGCRAGYVMANVDSVDITVRGRGGHGAHPHTTIDPIVQAAQLVLALQTIVSREIDPIEPAVVTVGSIHAGTKHNIIADTCHLQLTVRSYSDQVRDQLRSSIERKARAVAAGAGAPEPLIEFSDGPPALKNDDELAGRLIRVFQRVLGADRVVISERAMVAEDFSEYGQAGVPIVMFRLGAVDGKRLERDRQLGRPPSLHSATFYPDVEATLVTGVTAMANAVLDLMKPSEGTP